MLNIKSHFTCIAWGIIDVCVSAFYGSLQFQNLKISESIFGFKKPT